MSRLRDVAVWALPPVVLVAFGLLLLGRGHGLWYDEAYTAQVATLPLPELARLVLDGRGPTDYLPGVPPSFNAPYYALVHLWLQLPGVRADEAGLRLPSLVCAAAAVSVLACTGRRLAGRRAGLVAGLLAATSPLLVEQAVEARSYGPALLATSLAGLGLVRRLDGAPWGTALFTAGATAAGLLHWFALPAIAGLVVAAVVVSRRDAVPLLALAAVASLPTLALVVLSLTQGTAGSPDPPAVGVALPALAVRDLALGRWPLVALTVAAALAGAWRGRGRAVALCWLLVPLGSVTLLELARPVYFARYLLPALLGLVLLAALGVTALPRRAGLGLAGALLVASALATASLADDGPKERGDDAVTLIAELQRPGEPVVAADARAALALDHFVPHLAPRLAADLVLPPQDPPADPAGAVWLVRFGRSGFVPSDDDAVLLAAGLQVVDQVVLTGVSGDLRVERWARP